MNKELIIGIIVGWLLWRWYSGLAILPFSGGPMYDESEDEMEADLYEIG